MSSHDSSTLYQTLLSTALSHVRAYESPTPFSNASIQRLRTKDCVHTLHPAESIPSPFNLPIEGENFAHAMELYGGPVSRLSFEIRDAVVDVEKRVVVVRLDATYDFKKCGDDEEVSGWRTQYMWLTEMDGEGTKVRRVEEFLDPGRLMGFVKGRAERWEEARKRGEV